jgi:hypothetical protein
MGDRMDNYELAMMGVKIAVLKRENRNECVRYALQYDPKITFLEMHERAIEFRNNETFIWIRNEKNEESINTRFNLIMQYGDLEKIKRFRNFISDYCNGRLLKRSNIHEWD